MSFFFRAFSHIPPIVMTGECKIVDIVFANSDDIMDGVKVMQVINSFMSQLHFFWTVDHLGRPKMSTVQFTIIASRDRRSRIPRYACF